MQSDHIQYRGRYEYADRLALEHALTSARATIEDEDLSEVNAWLRFFVSRGTSLTVNLVVPDCSEHRFVAANMFLVLAHGATDGHVEAVHQRSELLVDRYDAGDED